MAFAFNRPLRHLTARSTRLLGVALGAAALSCAALSVQAAPTAESRTIVGYQDLDLSKRAAAVELYARLKRAADSVCGNYDTRDLRSQRVHQQCYDQALSDAVERVGHAAVSALHREDDRIRFAGGEERNTASGS